MPYPHSRYAHRSIHHVAAEIFRIDDHYEKYIALRIGHLVGWRTCDSQSLATWRQWSWHADFKITLSREVGAADVTLEANLVQKCTLAVDGDAWWITDTKLSVCFHLQIRFKTERHLARDTRNAWEDDSSSIHLTNVDTNGIGIPAE